VKSKILGKIAVLVTFFSQQLVWLAAEVTPPVALEYKFMCLEQDCSSCKQANAEIILCSIRVSSKSHFNTCVVTLLHCTGVHALG
jgi:hypothetical protein